MSEETEENDSEDEFEQIKALVGSKKVKTQSLLESYTQAECLKKFLKDNELEDLKPAVEQFKIRTLEQLRTITPE